MFVCPRTRGPLQGWRSVGAGVVYPLIDGVPVLVPDPRGFLLQTSVRDVGSAHMSRVDGPDAITPHLAYGLLGAPGGLGQWLASVGDDGPDAACAAFADEYAPEGPALDVGCGIAPMARRMVGLGRETWAIDLSLDAVLMAKAVLTGALSVVQIPTHRNGLRSVRVPFRPVDAVNFAVADAATPPFARGSFAWVHLGDVLDSAGDRVNDVLYGAADLVMPGGMLTLSTAFGSLDEPAEGAPAPEGAILDAMAEMGFDVVAQSDRVPHIRRVYDRNFDVRLFFCLGAVRA